MSTASSTDSTIKPWFSHHLAHGKACNPGMLALWLEEDKALGYKGMTIVPILWEGNAEMTPDVVAKIFQEAEMEMQVCGFLPGNRFTLQTGPGRHEALDSLQSQFEFVKAAVALGVGPNRFVGPLDVAWKAHKQKQIKNGWTIKNYRLWLRALQRFAEKNDTRLAIEFLNRDESPNPFPFENLTTESEDFARLYLHWDTGHAAMLELCATDFADNAENVLYFEAANWGRHPLSKQVEGQTNQIDFRMYFDQFDELHSEATFGVEPFDYQLVIVEFGLEDLCTTRIAGTDCLLQDAEFLINEGMMELALAS